MKKIHIVKNKKAGFTQFSEGLSTKVPVHKIHSLKKGIYYEVVPSFRCNNPELYRVEVPRIVGDLTFIFLHRSSKEVTGDIVLDVVLIDHEMPIDKVVADSEQMADEYERAMRIFGKKEEKEDVSELLSDVRELFRQKRVQK